MAGAHVSEADRLEIAAKFTAYVIAHNKASVEAGEWPAVLGRELYDRAIKGGYFGPPGTVPGLDYGDGKQEGAQVKTTIPDDGSPAYAELFVDGELVATKKPIQPSVFDTVAWAKEFGVDI